MTDNAVLVLNAFFKLSDADKKEVIIELEIYERKDWFQKGQMNEDFQERTKRIMGPVNSAGCPICGR
jgi:hypothetical protein